MKALLIIDMQIGCFSPYSVCHDTAGIIERINTVSGTFRNKNYPVIFMQHDGTGEGDLIPGTESWNLLPELIKSSTDLYITKTANDSFYKTSLQQILFANKINDLFITGYATDFCVDATAKSALTKDYKVTMVSDCHTTENKKNLSATAIIAHYNRVWAAMAPAAYKISVETACAIKI